MYRRIIAIESISGQFKEKKVREKRAEKAAGCRMRSLEEWGEQERIYRQWYTQVRRRICRRGLFNRRCWQPCLLILLAVAPTCLSSALPCLAANVVCDWATIALAFCGIVSFWRRKSKASSVIVFIATSCVNVVNNYFKKMGQGPLLGRTINQTIAGSSLLQFGAL